MEGPARAGHDPGGGLRLEWPDFRQPIPDRQGDHGDQLERPSLLRASAGKTRRCGSRKGPPKERGEHRRENSAWRIARKGFVKVTAGRLRVAQTRPPSSDI